MELPFTERYDGHVLAWGENVILDNKIIGYPFSKPLIKQGNHVYSQSHLYISYYSNHYVINKISLVQPHWFPDFHKYPTCNFIFCTLYQNLQ